MRMRFGSLLFSTLAAMMWLHSAQPFFFFFFLHCSQQRFSLGGSVCLPRSKKLTFLVQPVTMPPTKSCREHCTLYRLQLADSNETAGRVGVVVGERAWVLRQAILSAIIYHSFHPPRRYLSLRYLSGLSLLFSTVSNCENF